MQHILPDTFGYSRKQIFLNADDFGVSPRANRNILFLISLGKIDRVGVMSRGKISMKEVAELEKSEIKIDIHLDVLHAFDGNRKKRKSALGRGLEFLWKIFSGKLTPKKVEDDWRKQIEEFREIFGKNPDGINSHEHVHFFPPFFKIALKLAQEYSIPYVRFGSSQTSFHKPVALILGQLRMLDRKMFKKSNLITTEKLVSLDWIEDVEKFLQHLPQGTMEIACHPEIAEDFVRIKKFF